jgi:transcription elongation factor GreB
MSKAFAPGESDSDEERNVVKAPVLPPGTPNYITPDGAARLDAARQRTLAEIAAQGETVENKARKRTLEYQLEFLTERLNRARVIDPENQPKDRVLFGARVTVRDAKGASQTWRIVGVDETDLAQGWVSWISPLARALLEKKVGDTVVLGDQRLTLLAIT